MRQWWNNATISKFRQRAQCIVDQYSSYKLQPFGHQVSSPRPPTGTQPSHPFQSNPESQPSSQKEHNLGSTTTLHKTTLHTERGTLWTKAKEKQKLHRPFDQLMSKTPNQIPNSSMHPHYPSIPFSRRLCASEQVYKLQPSECQGILDSPLKLHCPVSLCSFTCRLMARTRRARI